MHFRSVLRQAFIVLAIFVIGFILSSGIAADYLKKPLDRFLAMSALSFSHHVNNLMVDARHYFILPENAYKIELFTNPMTFSVIAAILFNSIFNILFQPVFLCIVTPQVVLNILLFPFFIAGAIIHFKKVWPLLLVFAGLAFLIGIYDSVIEALIRHGMVCELIYLLVGLAGFTSLISKRS